MKRIFVLLIFAFLAACLPSYADTLTADEAKAVAEKFFGIGVKGTKSSSATLSLVRGKASGATGSSFSGATKSSADSAEPSFYVFNRSTGGYVIISAESGYHPVLGYSLTESFSFEDLPDGMQWLLDILDGSIIDVRRSGAEGGSGIDREWEHIGSALAGAGSTATLATAEWGQDAPYNDQCPMVTGESSLAVTGCVATATAILMHWQANHRSNVPDRPEYVTVPAYSYTKNGTSISIPARNLSGRVYDFSAMPYSDDDMQNASSTVKRNVADLMSDLGHAYKMQYGKSSGTQSSLAVYTLGTYFKYRKDNRTEMYENYSEAEWFAKIKDSIDNGNPVFYAGQEQWMGINMGGHCFLIDGYDEANNLIRFNYGWNGLYHDSFLRLGNQYAYSQEAVFNLVPNTDGSSQAFPPARISFAKNGSYSGLIASDEIAPGKSVDIKVGFLANSGPEVKKFYLRLVHVSAATGVRTPFNIYADYSDGLAPGYMVGYTFPGISVSSSQFKLGDYIAAEYSEDYPSSLYSVKTWVPLDSTPLYGEVVTRLPVIPIPFLDIPESGSVGVKYELKLVNCDQPWAYDTKWSWSSEQASASAVIAAGGTNNHHYITFSKAGTYVVKAEIGSGSGKENIRAVIEIK